MRSWRIEVRIERYSLRFFPVRMSSAYGCWMLSARCARARGGEALRPMIAVGLLTDGSFAEWRAEQYRQRSAERGPKRLNCVRLDSESRHQSGGRIRPESAQI